MDRSDTTAEAQAVQRAVYRALSGPERVALAFSLSEDARRLSLEGIARRHPELDEASALIRLIEMLHGPTVAAYARQQQG